MARIETVDGKQVLLLKRFDRDGTHRVPFLPAMSMYTDWKTVYHKY